MRKAIYTTSASLMLLLAMILGFTSRAEVITLDETGTQELVTGQEYLVPASKTIKAYFVAPTTGKLTVVNGGDLGVWDNAECKFGESLQFENSVQGGDTRVFSVEEGQTYWFYNTFTMNEKTMTLYMEGENVLPLEIAYYQPTNDALVDFNNYSNLQITFNQAIQNANNEKAVITFANRLTGTTQILEANQSVQGTMLNVVLYNNIRGYLQSGAILPGDEFKVTVQGITAKESDAKPEAADANGNLVYTFKCGNIPVVKTSAYAPQPFLSYWPAGTEEGIARMTFSSNLKADSNAKCTFIYGSPEGEEGTYYIETLPVTIEGNALSVDFTGKQRIPSVMAPLATAVYSQIQFIISGVVDEYGVPVGSEGSGTMGSYTFVCDFKELEKSILVGEFDPASGENLANESEMNVWLSGLNGISFTGFNIAYTVNGEALNTVIPVADCTISGQTGDGNEANYAFAIPAAVKTAQSVVITLAGMTSLDGYDHTSDVRGVFNTFTITYSDPANGTKLASLKDGDIIEIETNYDSKYPDMYLTYEIIDVTNEDEVIKSFSWLNRQENGSFQAEIILATYKLMVNHEYHIVVNAWENEEIYRYDRENTLGQDYVALYGETPEYIYSTVAFESIYPAEGADVVLSQYTDSFTVTFDGLVSLTPESTFIVLGQGATIPFKALTPNDEVDPGYSASWTLELPDNYIASLSAPLTISFKATDQLGRVVQGPIAEEEQSHFMFTYNVAGMYKEVTVSYDETADEISEFTVEFSEGINFSYQFRASAAEVRDLQGTLITTVKEYKAPETDPDTFDDTIFTTGTLVLAEPISEAGSYVLMIPEGYFALGTEFNTFTSARTTFRFAIEAPIPDTQYEVEPAEGKVTELDTLILTFTGAESVAEGIGHATLTYNNGEEVVLPATTFDWDDDMNMIRQPLGQTYTADGEYRIFFPAGYFTLGDDAEPAGSLELIYTIGEGNGVDLTVVADRYVVYTIQGVKVLDTEDAELFKALEPGIYVVNGLKLHIGK